DLVATLRKHDREALSQHLVGSDDRHRERLSRRCASCPAHSGAGTVHRRRVASDAAPTSTRAPLSARERSTASIIRTTSTPIELDERGATPPRIALQKSLNSNSRGSAASTRGE